MVEGIWPSMHLCITDTYLKPGDVTPCLDVLVHVRAIPVKAKHGLDIMMGLEGRLVLRQIQDYEILDVFH